MHRPQLRRPRAIATAFLALVAGTAVSALAQTIPSDPAPSCSAAPSEVNGWFLTGSIALDGVVNPANSVTFPDQPNCSFYKWSEQMFLWLTSPAPSFYGGGGRIFDSTAFFDVSPLQNGERTFIPHQPGKLRVFNLREAQVGPHRLPILFDKAGRMLEIERPHLTAVARLRVRGKEGDLIEVERARVDKEGRTQLLDRGGKLIERPLPLAERDPGVRSGEPIRVQRFLIHEVPVFIDLLGNVIDVEQGQADGGVLQAQNGSLVYYATMVNDVYAYFLTGVKNNIITPGTHFPTTDAELNPVVALAAAHGKTFADPAALAVEVKTAWVEAAGLANLDSYITMTATIPTYDRSNPAQWVPKGQTTAQLALVGIHVVGSTKGHPEMIWATFEHVANAPNGPYLYLNAGGHIVQVPQETAGTWLFCASGSSGPFNEEHMQQPFGAATIQALSPHQISASDTIRWKAWGAASDISPNPVSGSPAASNSEIIAINNSVRGLLAAGDLRKNYVMTGATWTIGGNPPGPTNQVGTSKLCNTTMETYNQGISSAALGGSMNCFSCHTSNSTDVSHVFGDLKPLF